VAGLLTYATIFVAYNSSYITSHSNILSSPIEYLKGVGPLRGDLLKKELGIFTFNDLLNHFPNRHVDKTKVSFIGEINPQTDYIQVAGKLISIELVGEKRGKRLIAYVQDTTGMMELVWFQGINWVSKSLVEGATYLLFGKTSFFNGKPQMVHPEIEIFTNEKREGKAFLEPIYPATEKLKARGLSGRQLAKLTYVLLAQLQPKDIEENLPDDISQRLQLIPRYAAYKAVHFPADTNEYDAAIKD